MLEADAQGLDAAQRLHAHAVALHRAGLVEVLAHAAQGVAAHLRLAAVGVEDAHARVAACGGQDQHQPVGANAEVLLAELLCQRRGVACLHAPGVLAAEKDKVIAKAVHFDEFHPSISRFFPFPPLYQKAGALPRRGAQKIFSGR